MKKVFLSLIAVPLLFMGCSEEQAANADVTPQAGMETETIRFSTAKLQFASMEELDKAINEVAMMTPEEKQAWEASREGFVSMNTAVREVVEQMRTVTSKTAALALRKAYSDLFLFDPSEQTISLVPLFKSNRIGYQFVCNAYGEVEVAGQTVNLNDLTSYEQTWVAKAIEESAAATRGARKVNSITLSPLAYQRFIATSSCNIVNGRAQVFARYTGQTIVNETIAMPTKFSYTVSYVQGITNNAVISSFDTNFDYYKLTSMGDSFTHSTPAPDHMVDEFIGWANTTYSTGYKISVGSKEDILFFQNY